jgi:phosphopantothenoylcysteine decarboxylase/phosphopantothenate--cysteine ligase
VILVRGPVNVPDPAGVTVVRVETAQEMLAAVEKALPADVAVFAAAVADWRAAEPTTQKIKKGATAPPLALMENADILAAVAQRTSKRPTLVVGFAAETDNVVANAKDKLKSKGCDWIVANDVSPSTGTFGGDRNTVHLVSAAGVDSWPPQSKDQVAKNLVARIAAELGKAK